MSLTPDKLSELGGVVMRGVWDKLCTLYRGSESSSGVPGTIYQDDVPCRLVVQDQIFQVPFPFDLCSSWITLGFIPLPNFTQGGVRDGVMWSNYNSCVVVEVPKGSGHKYVGVRNELVIGSDGGLYQRLMLLPIEVLTDGSWLPPAPLPPVPPPVAPYTPSTTCVGAFDLPYGDVARGVSVSPTANWLTCSTIPVGTSHISLLSGPPTTLVAVYDGACPGGLFLRGYASVTTPLAYTNSGGSPQVWMFWTAAVGVVTDIQVGP